MPADLLDVNGHKLYVEQRGSPGDPALILLHHGLGSTLSWKDQVPALLGAGYRVLAYDRWGYGKSAPRPRLSAPAFEQDIQDLRSLLAQMDLGTAGLVGHSDGGTIALSYAARYPGQVSCLVVVAAHIYVETKMGPGIQAVRLAFERDAGFRKGLKRLHAEMTEDVFWNWYRGWMKPESLTWDMRPVLGSINCPTLVVQGDADEHASPQHARDIAAAIPGAELWLLPGGRHMLPQEQAQRFNQKVLEFLEKVGKREHEDVQ